MALKRSMLSASLALAITLALNAYCGELPPQPFKLRDFPPSPFEPRFAASAWPKEDPVVDSIERQQVARVMHRSNLTPAAVEAIMANQVTREQRLSHADDVVRNDSDLQALREEVAALHQKYLGLAGQALPTR